MRLCTAFRVLLSVVWLCCGCTGDTGGPDGGSRSDGSISDGLTLTGEAGSGVCPGQPCPGKQLCYKGHCVEDLGTCTGDEDCLGDSFCHQGSCIPFGPKTKTHDPTCNIKGFASEKLVAPQVKCQWTKGWVVSTPLVADLDGDKKPEIIFIGYPGLNNTNASLVAIRGDSCSEVFNVSASVNQHSNLAVADLTGDKIPEIVGVDKSHRVVIFDNKGKLLATSAKGASATAYGYIAGGPAIANLDGVGAPEIIYGGMALRYQAGKLTSLYNLTVPSVLWGHLSAVADVDLDGKLEVVAGNRIIDGLTGVDETPAAIKSLPSGYVAIAEFDKSTPEPEIVLVSSAAGSPAVVRIFHPKTGKVIFGPYTFGQKFGGPPTVADFDGDGQPEVAVSGYVGYALFDQECAKTPLPTFCQAPGLRWLKKTRDYSSGATGSSVFDFNGDGKAEVVYRDECWLRVYDGTTGKVLFAHFITSGTMLDMPVVADVDGDNHAEIVVSSTAWSGCKAEPDLGLAVGMQTKGVLVLEDPKDRWMDSRPIWNQHTYHITNVNDDGTVPLKEKHSWATWNNYRQNVQGMVKKESPAPDLTGKKHVGIDAASDCVALWVLLAKICNRGAANAPAGVKGTFYLGDPRTGGTAICTAATTKALSPGGCETVKCNYLNPTKGKIDLWFAADDDGSGDGSQVECKEKNNLLHLPKVACPGIAIES